MIESVAVMEAWADKGANVVLNKLEKMPVMITNKKGMVALEKQR